MMLYIYNTLKIGLMLNTKIIIIFLIYIYIKSLIFKMNIIPSTLLKPTKKTIRSYDCNLIASEGPNLVGKFSLGSLEIPFDSQFTSVMTIQPNQQDLPVMYGFIGTNITFLAIKVLYNSQEQNSSNKIINDNKYLEYYYEDEPLVRRTLTDILILSGNANNRIPQIFLYNPSEYVAQVYIMAANLEENTISKSLYKNTDVIKGLYYNSILSDIIEYNINNSGSSQLEIYDYTDRLLTSIPISEINIINIDSYKMTIITNYNKDIKLEFNSDYNAKQAHSRINWLLKDYQNRFLTKEYPIADTRSPIISWYNTNTVYTGLNLTKLQLQESFIQSIYDNNDGEISRYDTEVIIRKKDSIREFDIINEIGNYEIIFKISDIAGNETIATKEISMYDSAPEIIFKNIDNNMYINDTWYYKDGRNIITSDDIINNYIDSVYDYVDTLTKSDLLLDITFTGSGSTNGIETSGITKVGYYNIEFILTNRIGMTTRINKLLFARTNEFLEPIINFKYDYNINTIIVPTGLTKSDFINLVVDSFDNIYPYDNVITLNDIEIEGDMPFPTTHLSTNYTVIFKIKNYSGVENISQINRVKYVNVSNIILSNPVINFYTYNDTNLINISAITKTELISIFIDNVTDYNDGIIDKYSISVKIYDGINEIQEIINDGEYGLNLSIFNSQGRGTIINKNIIVNSDINGGDGFSEYEFILDGNLYN